LIFAALFAMGGIGVVAADEGRQAAAPLVLLELYTSQGCYSCPPAEELLHEIYARRDDVIALEFHVDYWDTLVYGFAGSWKDPFSSQLHTERQVVYNKKLRNTRSVYTPQMIVQGRHQSGGAQQNRIEQFVRDVRDTLAPPVRFYFDGKPTSGLTVALDGVLRGDEKLYYALYWLEKTTAIPSGENKGKTLTSSNIVKMFGSRPATERRLTLPVFDASRQGCAVWLQDPASAAVLAAVRCPTS